MPAVLSHHLGAKERLRLATRCRQRLEGLDVDVLVKSPDEIRDYHDKRGGTAGLGRVESTDAKSAMELLSNSCGLTAAE